MRQYVCPLCHVVHFSRSAARECLKSCLEVKEAFVEKVFCPFCNSPHDTLEDAVGCAADCYLESNKNALSVTAVIATCVTCSCCTDSGTRVYPCPHRRDVNPPDACAAYDPDVRECGTAIATEYNHMLLTASAAQVAERAVAQSREE